MTRIDAKDYSGPCTFRSTCASWHLGFFLGKMSRGLPQLDRMRGIQFFRAEPRLGSVCWALNYLNKTSRIYSVGHYENLWSGTD